MIIKTASMIKKILLSFFIALLLLLGISYLFLQQGIEIESLNLPFLKAQKLYLKLDKKLILKVDRVQIKKQKEKSKTLDEKKIVKNLNQIEKFFEKIEIKRLSYQNYNVTFLYNPKGFFIDTDDYRLKTQLHTRGKRVFLNIEEFKYKKLGISFKGKSLIDLKNKTISFNGQYFIEAASGNIRAAIENGILNFKIDSNSFNNKTLESITDLFPLNKKIKLWIYRKIVAKSYKIRTFKGEIDLKTKKIKNLFATVNAYDAAIKFNKNLPPVKTKKITLTYKDNSLYFRLEKPTYLDKDLDGSYVIIKHPGNKDSYIDIILNTSSPLDKNILNIVKNYNVHLPIYQKKGVTKAWLKIRVVFKNYKLFLDGKFQAKNSLFNINGINIYAYNANVRLKNSKIFIDDSLVEIKKIIKSHIEGRIDLHKKIGKIDLKNARLNIEAKNHLLLYSNNYQDILSIDFSKKDVTKLDLKNIKTSILMKKNSTDITLSDLKTIKRYSPVLKKTKIRDGNLSIATKNFEKFYVKSKIFADYDLIYYKNRAVKNFDIDGVLDDITKLNINNKIKIFYKKDLKISIRDYDLHIKEFNNSDANNKIDFTLYGYSSNINIFGREILSSRYILKYKNARFDFKNIYKNSILSVQGTYKRYIIDAKNLDETFVKNFLNTNEIKGGIYNLKAIGKRKNIEGTAIFYNATLKDMVLLNNIMAFLNTIPSLATFSDPGYNKYGYYVKKGEIRFALKDGILYIKNLNLKGKSLNFQGSGVIDLNSNTINMDITLISFKNISNILNKIPVAGYILLGKEGNISTKLKIKGNLLKPKISTNIPKEAVKAPLNILKRTLTLPFEIFK